MRTSFFLLFVLIANICNAQVSLTNPGEGWMKVSIANSLPNRALYYSESIEGEQITLAQYPQDFYLLISNPNFYMWDYGEQTYTYHNLTPESASPQKNTIVKFQWYQERDDEIKLLTNYMQDGIRYDYVRLGHTYDLNFDEEINTEDFNLLMSNFGGSGMGDVNKDNEVNGTDFLILQTHRQPNALPAVSSSIRTIPEPRNIILGLIGAFCLYSLARINRHRKNLARLK